MHLICLSWRLVFIEAMFNVRTVQGMTAQSLTGSFQDLMFHSVKKRRSTSTTYITCYLQVSDLGKSAFINVVLSDFDGLKFSNVSVPKIVSQFPHFSWRTFHCIFWCVLQCSSDDATGRSVVFINIMQELSFVPFLRSLHFSARDPSVKKVGRIQYQSKKWQTFLRNYVFLHFEISVAPLAAKRITRIQLRSVPVTTSTYSFQIGKMKAFENEEANRCSIIISRKWHWRPLVISASGAFSWGRLNWLMPSENSLT